MDSSPLDLYAREYFNSLNCIAEKISADITTTVAAYEDLWHTLSVKDQHQVINETIIHPEVVLKYSLCRASDDNIVKRNSLSRSYFGDEGKGTGVSWSDEHSAPFSWKTRSQQDLSIFCDRETDTEIIRPVLRSSSNSVPSEKPQSNHDTFIDPPDIVLGGSSSKLALAFPVSQPQSVVENGNVLTKMRTKSVVLKIQTTKAAHKSDSRRASQTVGESENPITKINASCRTSKTLPSKFISKPKNPPPPPPKSKQVKQNSTDINDKKRDAIQEPCLLMPQENINKTDELFFDSVSEFNVDMNAPIKNDVLPKTGFDFLDNW